MQTWFIVLGLGSLASAFALRVRALRLSALVSSVALLAWAFLADAGDERFRLWVFGITLAVLAATAAVQVASIRPRS